MGAQRFFACIFLIVSVIPAHALERFFPPTSKRGTMSPAPFPSIIIDGKLRQMTAGAQIRNDENRIDMPASIRGSDFIVNYVETPDGEIDRIWILTQEEINSPPSGSQGK